MNQDIKILVVDDEPEILFATVRILQKAGFCVDQATTGSECLRMARADKPDLIFLDVVLPDVEGSEVCRQIKTDPFFRGTFVILVSGRKTASDDQAEGLDKGADGYIARPIANREFLARTHAFVRILTAERERDRLIVELREALAKVKTLSGLLPLCMHCKKVRDDEGYWGQLEAFVQKHSNTNISHSICPECAEKIYPEMGLYDDEWSEE